MKILKDIRRILKITSNFVFFNEDIMVIFELCPNSVFLNKDIIVILFDFGFL